MSRPRALDLSNIDDSRPGQATPSASGTRRALGFGNYRLFARLGSGGMADVYLAIAHGAMNVNRLLVVKRLREEHANDAATREMFLDEARLAARLTHPNVVQTFEAGQENGSFFLAMEYVDGQPYSRILTALKREGEVLDARLAARVCADMLNGLHYAHELTDFDGRPLEIVHRDVSPQNVMIAYEGTVKIVDFGIAKAVGTPQTEHGVFKGKVAFMAPEQVRAEGVDRRADVFAAGIVLWESVTGKHLMAESTPAATLYNLMSKVIPRASEVNPSVPAVLDEIIARALQRDVAQRYPTAKAMRDDLEAFIVSVGGVRNEELGALVKRLFADTRAKVQEQIRAQLTTLSLGRGESGESGRPATDSDETQILHTPMSVSRLVALDDGYVEASSKASVFRVVTAATPTQSMPRRVGVAVWFFIPLLTLGATTWVLYRAQHLRTEPAPTDVPAATLDAASQQPKALLPSPGSLPSPAASPESAGASSASSSASTRATTPPPPPAAPRPVWVTPTPRPVAPPTPQPSPTPTPVDPPKPTAPATPPPKPQDPPQGRTFRRDL